MSWKSIRNALLPAVVLGSMAMGIPAECRAAHISRHIYWSESQDGIVRANSDGSNATALASQWASKLAVDKRSNSVFWTGLDGVYRRTVNGEITRLVSFADQTFFTGIALDHVRDHIYFVEAHSSAIYRTDLDGGNQQVVVRSDGQSTNITRIDDLRIDVNGEKLYWSNVREHSFYRSNLDGSGQELLFSFPGYIHDFDIDPQNQRIYWSKWGFSQNGGAVLRANINGTQQETLISDGLWGVYGLAVDVDAGKMYFTDTWTSGPTNYDGTIRTANLDGSMVRTIANLGPTNRPEGIAFGLIPEPSSSAIVVSGLLFVSLASRRRTARA
jgi:sugar lactone lactonase YvrE